MKNFQLTKIKIKNYPAALLIKVNFKETKIGNWQNWHKKWHIRLISPVKILQQMNQKVLKQLEPLNQNPITSEHMFSFCVSKTFLRNKINCLETETVFKVKVISIFLVFSVYKKSCYILMA